MITDTVLLTVILCTTTVIVAELLRRYYVTKHEYEYKVHRLDYDDNILAADGGEEEGEVDG